MISLNQPTNQLAPSKAAETEVAIAPDATAVVSRLSRAEALPLKAGELLMSSRFLVVLVWKGWRGCTNGDVGDVGLLGWLAWNTWRSSNVNQGGSLSNLRQVDVF